MDLTETEIIGLRWMASCNARNIGYLGPSVRRSGPLPEYERLVSGGYAKVVYGYQRRPAKKGYWMLPKGHTLLDASLSGQ